MKPSLLDLAFVTVGVAALTAAAVMSRPQRAVTVVSPTPTSMPTPTPTPEQARPLPPPAEHLRLDLDLRFAVTNPIAMSPDATHGTTCAEAFDVGLSALRIDRRVVRDRRTVDLVELDVVPLRVARFAGDKGAAQGGVLRACSGGTGRFGPTGPHVIVIDDDTGRSDTCSLSTVYRRAPATLSCSLITGARRLRFKIVDAHDDRVDEPTVGEFTVDTDSRAVAVVNAGAAESDRVGDVQDLRAEWSTRVEPAVQQKWLLRRLGLSERASVDEVAAHTAAIAFPEGEQFLWAKDSAAVSR